MDRGLNVENTNKSILPYFQHVLIASIHLKIDYEPGIFVIFIYVFMNAHLYVFI
jgi:hypothetical protein